MMNSLIFGSAGLAHFFRAREDGFVFQTFSCTHWILLIVWLGGMVSIFFARHRLRRGQAGRRLSLLLATILLLDQLVLYGWQFGSGYFSLGMSLPLYHCRLAVPLMIIGIYSGNRLCKQLALYWGMLGTMTAMILPDLYAFHWPHYTNIQFFLVHILLGWLVAYLIFVERPSFTVRALGHVLGFTLVFNLLICGVNVLMRAHGITEANYAFLYEAPTPLAGMTSAWSTTRICVVTIVVYLAVITVMWLISRYILSPLAWRGDDRRHREEGDV